MSDFRQVIKGKNNALNFGKHKGASIRQVLLSDPEYILWLYEQEIVDFPEDIIIEAEERSDGK